MKPYKRHNKTYDPFCPHISVRPTPSYNKIVKDALRLYPGAGGDATLALAFMAQHYRWSIERAIKHYSEYHEEEDRREYQKRWISRCVEYWEERGL